MKVTVGSELPPVHDERRLAVTRAGTPADESVADAVEVFKVLANPARLRLLHALAHDELSVGDLAHAFGLTLSSVSHQLGILRRMKLVSARDVGRSTLYRATSVFVGNLVHDCLAHLGKAHRHPHRQAPRKPARPRGAR